MPDASAFANLAETAGELHGRGFGEGMQHDSVSEVVGFEFLRENS